MLQLRQGVKNTPAHVHDLYSCWYNMSVHSVYISWHGTFGLHTGPLSDTVKSTCEWATAAGLQREKLYT